MHLLDLVDETYIAAPSDALAVAVADPARWRTWWPARRLEVFMDRGPKGQRWSVSGDVVGSSEIWLEAYRDGTILHYYLRADPAGADRGSRPLRRQQIDRLRRAEATAWKRSVWALKQEFEGQRRPGTAGA